jgi:hypothetical protein
MLAAWVHVTFFSMAFLITSSLVTIRAFLATGSSRILYGYPSRLWTGHLGLLMTRTFRVSPTSVVDLIVAVVLWV